MKTHIRHPWDVTPQQAIDIQEQLRPLVIRQDALGRLATVAGVDASFDEGSQLVRAAAVVLSLPELHILEQSVAFQPLRFPYIPGLLSFREAPAILEALDRLKTAPDLLLCDGQGLAHPRRCGLACHLGLLCDLPSIGVAKSRLLGRHEPVSQQRGAWQPLLDGDEVVGAALRTRPGAHPLYVSIGHRISLDTAIDLALRCCVRYRLPEPLRQAHKLASQ